MSLKHKASSFFSAAVLGVAVSGCSGVDQVRNHPLISPPGAPAVKTGHEACVQDQIEKARELYKQIGRIPLRYSGSEIADARDAFNYAIAVQGANIGLGKFITGASVAQRRTAGQVCNTLLIDEATNTASCRGLSL